MAYGYNVDKRLDAQQVVYGFSTDYYYEQISKLNERITHIQNYGQDSYGYSEGFKTQKEKEKRIEELREQIKEYNKKIREVSEMISNLKSSVNKFESIAIKDALLSSLHTNLSTVLFYAIDDGDNGYKLVSSETRDKVLKGKLFGKSKYNRLHYKDLRDLRSSKGKISKKVYDSLKKVKKRISGNPHGTTEGFLSENGYSIKGFADRLYGEIRADYYKDESISRLGVNIHNIKEASRIMEDPNYLQTFGCEIYREIKYFADTCYVSSIHSQLIDFKNKFERLFRLSRETEALDYIISAYSNTAISSTDSFNELRTILSHQRRELRELESKLTKDYNNSKIRDMVESQKRLEELYELYLEKNRLIEEEKDLSQYRLLVDEISQIKWEMMSIVKKYPKLNKQKFDIDLTTLEKHIRELEKELSPKKNIKSQKELENVEEVELEDVDIEVESSQVYGNDYQLKTDSTVKDKKKTEKKAQIKYEPVVVPDNFREVRTFHYQNYMIEKMKKSELSKLKFSEYLEKVAPYLTDLIEVEKERELRAANVYKMYLQYLASLEDKSKAMKFSEYAKIKYGFESVDIPVEYDEMERNRTLS